MTPKIRFRTLRNYNDLECDKPLSSFKYLIKEQNKKIYPFILRYADNKVANVSCYADTYLIIKDLLSPTTQLLH